MGFTKLSDYDDNTHLIQSSNMVFDFNSTSTHHNFTIEFVNIQLSELNCLSFCFIVIGDTSNDDGLKVTYVFNETMVDFIIPLIVQDSNEHNLTQQLTYSECFIELFSILVICEGQANAGESGSLVIVDTSIYPLEPPIIDSEITQLPAFPNWLLIPENLQNSESAGISSSFYFLNYTGNLNLSLSFLSNNFLALSKYVSVELNNATIFTEIFFPGQRTSFHFLLSPREGLNTINVTFTIELSTDRIEIYNILITSRISYHTEGNSEETFDWVEWEGSDLDYTFDISGLKPTNVDVSEQILEIDLNYKYLGIKSLPGINLEIISDSEIIFEGLINYNQQNPEPQTLPILTYTETFHKSLFLRISGKTNGMGAFIILKSSEIKTQPIPTLSEEDLERHLILEETSKWIFGKTIYWYSDYIRSKSSDERLTNLDVFCNFSINNISSFEKATLTVYIGNIRIDSKILSSQEPINISSQTVISSGISKISVVLELYGEDLELEIKDLFYQISYSSNQPNNNSSLYGVDWILALYGLLILALTEKSVRRRKLKNKPKEEVYEIEEQSNEENKRKVDPLLVKQLLACTIVSLITFGSLFWFFPDLTWLVSIFSIVCGYYASRFAEDLNKKDFKFKELRKRVKNFFSDIDTPIEFFSKIGETLSSSGETLLRTGITTLVVFCAFFNVVCLLFISRKLAFVVDDFVLGQMVIDPWKVYFIFYSIVILSVFVLFYQILMAWNFAFLEDHLKRIRILGTAALLLLSVFWLFLSLSISLTLRSFGTFGTVILPILYLGNFKLSTLLGNNKAEDLDVNYKKFRRKGKLWTNKKLLKLAVANDLATRTEWNKKKDDILTDKLRCIIINKITPGIQTSLQRLAELNETPLKDTENYIQKILNTNSEFGEYHPTEQVFVKHKIKEEKSLEIIKVEADEDNEVELQNTNGTEEIADEHDSDFKLDRVAIERDCEVNWVGIVRHRPEPSEGWITLPAEMRNKAELGSEYDVFLFTEEDHEVAFTTILKKSSAGSWFFYISATICSKSNLYGKEVSAFIKKHKEGEEFPWKKDNDLEEMEMLEWKNTKQVIEWEGRIGKGSSGGTGWITFPTELRESAEPGHFYDLSLVDSELKTHILTAKLSATKKGWGFYIPKALCIEHSLIGKTVTCYIYQMDHFPVKLSKDKIIRLPNSIVDEYEIKENDLFEVEVITDKGVFREIVLITRIDRSNRSDNDEYRLTLRLSDAPRSTDARIKLVKRVEKLPSNLKEEENYEIFYLPKLFSNAIMGKVHENEMIIFLGNHVPIFTPIVINLYEFIHYFGCFYADGTKVGPGWRTSASTPEQANYFIEKYNELIIPELLDFDLTYTRKPADKRSDNTTNADLVNYWKQHSGIEINENRITIRIAKSDQIKKWNKCGSLSIRDNKSLVLKLHLRLMEKIVSYLKTSTNEKHLWDFLFGILEGDGTVCGGNQRFGIGFACHKSDEIIRTLLKRLKIRYSEDSSRIRRNEGSGITVSFWLFEVLLNIKILSENLFRYYPKRRTTFIERLLKQSTVKFIMGKTDHLAPVSGEFFMTNDFDMEKVEQILLSLSQELKK